MPRALVTLLLLLALCVPLRVHAAALPTSVVVSWVYDGDTFKTDEGDKVRLLGIDTPEHEASGRDRFYLRLGVDTATLRRVSKEALQFVIRHAKGKRVTLTYDHTTYDKHGRLLAYVTLPDGRMLNRLLLEEGLAAVFRKFPFPLKEAFLEVEQRARAKKLGLWRE
ncbi:MAG: hypothetical protein C0624_08175 [Desulfuromonas sp.]|nr:MAG: hypothetical protein C0624_08175 [Desulfuromonas sp.]